MSRGIINRIVDSSSIEVNRRRRRTKTDRLDAGKLVTMLIRAEGGEQKVWSVINVPTPAEEDRRQVHRELLFARRDRGRHTNRIKGLLAGQGVPLARIQELPTHLVTARRWDKAPLPPLLCARLEREWETVMDYTTEPVRASAIQPAPRGWQKVQPWRVHVRTSRRTPRGLRCAAEQVRGTCPSAYRREFA